MKNHAPEFIRNRLEWSFGKHQISSKRTGYWRDAPDGLKNAMPADFENPVLFSIADCGDHATVIGITEIVGTDLRTVIRVMIDDVRRITSPCGAEGKAKTDDDLFSVTTARGDHHIFPTQSGGPCFAFWNVILRLINLQKS